MLRRMLALILTVKEREIAFIIQNALNLVLECDGTLDYCIHFDGDSSFRFMTPCGLIYS